MPSPRPPTASPSIAAFGDGALIDGVLDAPLETFDPETGEPISAGGSIHLEIVGTGEPFEFIAKTRPARFVSRGVTLDLEGTLTIGTMSFDLGDCIGIDCARQGHHDLPDEVRSPAARSRRTTCRAGRS